MTRKVKKKKKKIIFFFTLQVTWLSQKTMRKIVIFFLSSIFIFFNYSSSSPLQYIFSLKGNCTLGECTCSFREDGKQKRRSRVFGLYINISPKRKTSLAGFHCEFLFNFFINLHKFLSFSCGKRLQLAVNVWMNIFRIRITNFG